MSFYLPTRVCKAAGGPVQEPGHTAYMAVTDAASGRVLANGGTVDALRNFTIRWAFLDAAGQPDLATALVAFEGGLGPQVQAWAVRSSVRACGDASYCCACHIPAVADVAAGSAARRRLPCDPAWPMLSKGQSADQWSFFSASQYEDASGSPGSL